MVFSQPICVSLMPWLCVKLNYFKIISAFVDVRQKQFWQNYFRGLLHLMDIFQPNMFNVGEIILK